MPERKHRNHERERDEERWNNEGGAALDPEKLAKREQEELAETQEEFKKAFGKKKDA